MEIRDPVHGSIHILDEEIPIIENDFFGRLRNIKQLGFSEYVFPGATHTRFIHSIGVMDVGNRAFNKIFHDSLENSETKRLRETFKLACLLHDIGHAPLSHSTEIVMPKLKDLKIPKEYLEPGEDSERQATHEDYTIKAIIDSGLTDSFNLVKDKFGVMNKCVADLIRGHTLEKEYFTLNNINYFPLLHTLVSSELDCDRMDYLLRDSYFCGVSYGKYDLDWLLDSLEASNLDGTAYLGISERALVTFDDFLLSRYHMFVMVYFHYRAVCLEQLLCKYFETSPSEYQIPGSIDKYLEHDDHYLMKILRNSSNPYAQAIVKNKIPQKIYESFNIEQHLQIEKIQSFLESEKIDFIRCSSSGRLSKYYNSEVRRDVFPIKVVRKCLQKEDSYSNITEATKLFQKFAKSHSINRIHVTMDSLSSSQKSQLFDLLK